jgi:hypothetical protein
VSHGSLNRCRPFSSKLDAARRSITGSFDLMSVPALAQTSPPYYAAIFTSQRTEGDQGYGDMAERMGEHAGHRELEGKHGASNRAGDGKAGLVCR